jgi:NAD(P)-dependent dehydrogenase (short-subunit alcohol dehydrogenase family)
VALVARRRDRLEALADELRATGARVLPVTLDVTDAGAIPAAFDLVTEGLGVPDLLLNNAGVARTGPFLKSGAAERDANFATNFNAAWDLSAEAARRMVAAGKPGCILNVASVLALGGAPGYAAYATSKAALTHLTRCLALEFVRHGIRVNALAPGWFVTEMNDAFLESAAGQEYLGRIPPRRAGRLDELVGPALLLASDAGSFVNGVTAATTPPSPDTLALGQPTGGQVADDRDDDRGGEVHANARTQHLPERHAARAEHQRVRRRADGQHEPR